MPPEAERNAGSATPKLTCDRASIRVDGPTTSPSLAPRYSVDLFCSQEACPVRAGLNLKWQADAAEPSPSVYTTANSLIEQQGLCRRENTSPEDEGQAPARPNFSASYFMGIRVEGRQTSLGYISESNGSLTYFCEVTDVPVEWGDTVTWKDADPKKGDAVYTKDWTLKGGVTRYPLTTAEYWRASDEYNKSFSPGERY